MRKKKAGQEGEEVDHTLVSLMSGPWTDGVLERASVAAASAAMTAF